VIVIPPRAFCSSVTVTRLESSCSAAATSSRILTAWTVYVANSVHADLDEAVRAL
jgi:hypothetical protein